MTLPFTPDEFFDVLAAYNQRLWPYALGLWLLTLYAVIAMTRATPRGPLMPAVLALHWAWSGLAYHAAFFSTVNPAAWLFAGLFLVEAGLLICYGVVGRRLRPAGGLSVRSALSWGLIVYALLYPAIARAEGRVFPRLPTFGVPCPTTILTIGFLLAAESVLAARGRRHSDHVGVRRRVGCVLVRRARRSDTPRGRSGSGSRHPGVHAPEESHPASEERESSRSDDGPEQFADSSRDRHRQRTPERDAAGANGCRCTARARRQRAESRE